MARPEVRREYASWLALDRRTKVALNLPLTDQDFAEDKGTTTRTLRRWKGEPEFQTLVEQRRVELAKNGPNSTVAAVGGPRPVTDARSAARVSAPDEATPEDDPALDGDLTPGEADYVRVKDTLSRMARDGNQGAIDLYMKYYGKPFIEAETSDSSDLDDLTDEQLVNEVCELLGTDAVADWLADRAVAG